MVVLILIVGASLGIVYAAYHGSLLGVILASVVPGLLVGWAIERVQAGRRLVGDESL